MLKLLLCLLSATVLAAVVLQLRAQRLELTYETAELHDQIRGQQAKLWNQQLLIAACTAPNAIGQTVDTQGLNLVPQSLSTASPALPALKDASGSKSKSKTRSRTARTVN